MENSGSVTGGGGERWVTRAHAESDVIAKTSTDAATRRRMGLPKSRQAAS